jgi:N-methylhydantoinase A
MKYDYVRTYLVKMSKLKSEQLSDSFEELRQEGVARLEKDGIATDKRSFEYWLEMRYVGQHWDIPVPVNMGNGKKPELNEIVQEFHKRHELVHGYKLEEREVEIANLRLMAIGKSSKLKLKKKSLQGKDSSAAVKDRRRAYFGTDAGFLEVPVFDGLRLRPGNEFAGPAIVEKPSTTIIVYPDQKARLDERENLILDIQ